jgi:hypothetical protein
MYINVNKQTKAQKNQNKEIRVAYYKNTQQTKVVKTWAASTLTYQMNSKNN